jgi:hypothetical protein
MDIDAMEVTTELQTSYLLRVKATPASCCFDGGEWELAQEFGLTRPGPSQLTKQTWVVHSNLVHLV